MLPVLICNNAFVQYSELPPPLACEELTALLQCGSEKKLSLPSLLLGVACGRFRKPLKDGGETLLADVAIGVHACRPFFA
jgi:hypothetical protein